MIRQPEFKVKILVVLSFFILMGLIVTDVSSTDISGTQSGQLTFDKSPYIVTGNIIIPENARLTIEPGVVVKYAGYYSINVRGTLLALGLLGKRIVFTSIHDKEFGAVGQPTTSLPTNSDWVGIEIGASSSNSSKFEYCIIRYSDQVLLANNANPTISHVIIADCNAKNLNIDGKTIEVIDGNELDYLRPESILNENILPKPVGNSTLDEFSLPQQVERATSNIDEFTFGEIMVVSAAKQEQKLRESPANVTVITMEEINKMGYVDIVELLHDIMGIDINDPGQGQLDVGMRGINDRMAMGKHFQMLLDGHDMSWKQFYRNHISTAWIPLDAIDRIEIVRGPSSALWGANAFLGTINIITKSAKNNEDIYASATKGSFETFNGSLQVMKKIGNQGGISVFTSQFRDKLPRKIKEWSDIAKRDVILNANDRMNSNIYFKLSYGEVSIVGHQSRADAYQSVSSFSVGANYTRFVMDKKYFILGWQHQSSDKFSTKISGYYDYYSWGKGAQYEDNPYSGAMVDPGTSSSGHFVMQMDAKDDILGIQSQANFKPSQRFSLIFGVDYEKNKVVRWYYPEVWNVENLEIPKFKTTIWAVYVQSEITPIDWIKLSAGIRHDVHSIYKQVTNERIALILTPVKNIFVKALYGTAFKAPSIHELYYYRKNAYYGNPAITPEKNNTAELQIGYALGNLVELTTSIFKIDISDIIIYQKRSKSEPLIGEEDFPESQRPDGTKDYSQQINKGQWQSKGVEGEIKVNFNKQLMLYADATYRKALNVDTDEKLYYTADKQAKIGLRYFVSNKAYITLQARYVGHRTLPEVKFNEPDAPWQVTTDPTLSAPAYSTVDLAIFYPNLLKGLDFTTRIVNLLDKDQFYAGREVLYSLPSRAFLVKFGYHF